jgi:transposase-like protein
MSSTKRYSPEIRKIAYEAIKSGKSLTEISRNLGIGRATLFQWKRVGELPADYGRVAPSFRSAKKTSQPEEIYQQLFCKLPTLNQEFAEHLIEQYEGGIFFAIEYAKLTLRRIQKGNE